MKCLYIFVRQNETKTKIDMAYIKIKDRNLQQVTVEILSELGKHVKIVREDRAERYVSDYILFNGLKGKPLAYRFL